MGLYYLNARYYNGEWGRFVNADGQLVTGQSISGTNLFAYCDNNPISHEDTDGEMAAAAGVIAMGFSAGGANAWNPAGWAILGVTAIAALIILVIPWDTVGKNISIGWNQLKSYIKSNIRSAAISKAISNTDSKTKAKIKKERSRYDYWVALYVDFGDGKGTYIPTAPISFKRAISYVRRGGNVFADSKYNARKLARAVGGGYPEYNIEHGKEGFWKHYHATRKNKRIGGHILYVA